MSSPDQPGKGKSLGESRFGPEQFIEITGVSRETLERIEMFDRLFLDWAGRHNLVARSTLPARWQRHYLDSWQLLPLLPKGAQVLMDFGSGGGFPGLFLALLLAEEDGPQIYLVESIAKKCAFLRETVVACGLKNVTILNQRIEQVRHPEKADVITARALAGLERLLEYAYPFCTKDTVCLFMKGEKAQEELTQAAVRWKMQAIPHESITQKGAAILEIKELTPCPTR